jgi:cytochrome c-type biogenesis protein CcmH
VKRALAVVLLLFTPFAAAIYSQETKVPDAEQFVGKPLGTPVPPSALYVRTNEVGALLRCPVCQGLSVADSPSEMAVNMKGQVRELLARGYTEEQILRYFELSYGQFVLLEPKFEGMNTLVWLLPFVALLAGAVVVYFALRRLSAPRAADASPTTAASATTTPEDPYLARVRQMVGEGKQ